MSWFQTPLPISPDAIIRRALAEAQAAGKDHLTQTEEAVRAVLEAFPEMTASDTLAQVNRVRRQ